MIYAPKLNLDGRQLADNISDAFFSTTLNLWWLSSCAHMCVARPPCIRYYQQNSFSLFEFYWSSHIWSQIEAVLNSLNFFLNGRHFDITKNFIPMRSCYKQRYISVLFPCCSIKTAWDMAIFYFNEPSDGQVSWRLVHWFLRFGEAW